MAFYSVSIGNHEYQVSISGSQSLVDGKPLPVRLISLNGNGLHLIQHQDRATEVYVSAQDDQRYEVQVGRFRILARVEQPHQRAHRREKPSDGALTAPMHGLVVRVAVASGDVVEKGQTLIVLESMKMQMQLPSPVSGTVVNIAVESGGQVAKGSLLVRVDPAPIGENDVRQ